MTKPDYEGFAKCFTSAFFEDVAECFDHGDIQDMLEKYGIILPLQVTEPCGDACACAEWGFPASCYRANFDKD